MKIKEKLAKCIYGLAFFMAGLAVNSTCFARYYQEPIDPQLEVLRKYNDK